MNFKFIKKKTIVQVWKRYSAKINKKNNSRNRARGQISMHDYFGKTRFLRYAISGEIRWNNKINSFQKFIKKIA